MKDPIERRVFYLIERFFNVAPLKAAEARVRRLNEELEQHVVERTNELLERNEELRTAHRINRLLQKNTQEKPHPCVYGIVECRLQRGH